MAKYIGRWKMRLSTRGRYGLRVMFYLAKNLNSKPVPLSEIAGELDLSESYLEQLIRKLREYDLVTSSRGAYGGYRLSREPEAICVGEVLRILETHMSPCECTEGKDICEREDHCVTRRLWIRIGDSINDIIDNYTLQDMINDEKETMEQEEARA